MRGSPRPPKPRTRKTRKPVCVRCHPGTVGIPRTRGKTQKWQRETEPAVSAAHPHTRHRTRDTIVLSVDVRVPFCVHPWPCRSPKHKAHPPTGAPGHTQCVGTHAMANTRRGPWPMPGGSSTRVERLGRVPTTLGPSSCRPHAAWSSLGERGPDPSIRLRTPSRDAAAAQQTFSSASSHLRSQRRP